MASFNLFQVVDAGLWLTISLGYGTVQTSVEKNRQTALARDPDLHLVWLRIITGVPKQCKVRWHMCPLSGRAVRFPNIPVQCQASPVPAHGIVVEFE